jgi:predicted transcriptional regulator
MRELRGTGIVLFAVILATSALVSINPMATADPQMKPAEYRIDAPGMGDIIVDDFNSDGLDDLAVISFAFYAVNVYIQDPGGLPISPTGMLPSANLPSEITSGDVTDDGLPDIIVIEGSDIIVYERQPTVWFLPIAVLPVDHPRDVAVGDCGLDGLNDIYVTGATGTVIFIQDPPGVFDPLNTIDLPGAAGNALTLADVDSNNLVDIIVASPSHVSSYLQTDPNTYEIGSTLILDRTDYNPSYMSVGDVNSDNQVDIVIPRQSDQGDSSGILRIFFSSLSGKFSEDNGIELFGDISASTLITDLDDNGISEILVSLADGNLSLTSQSLDYTLRSEPLIVLNEPEGERLLASGNFGGNFVRDIAVRVPGSVLIFFMGDGPAELVMPIPSTFHLNEGEECNDLIDLRQHFFDDFGVLHFDLVYEEDTSKLDATLDRHFLDFEASSDWSGSLRFQVEAWDGNPENPPTTSNVFRVWVNDKPKIVSSPLADAEINSEYSYQIIVEDDYPEWDEVTYTLVRGPHGMQIDEGGLLTWTPRNPDEISIRVEVRDIFGFSDTQTFSITVAPLPEPPPVLPPETPYVAGTTAAVLTAVAVAAIISENIKWALLLLFVPLYSKIKRERVLDHFIRGQIYGYILANPGEHYNAIKQALNLTNGSLAHHLKTLEREDFIKSRKFGLYRRFYPKHMNIPEDGDFRMNPIQRHIVDVIDENPGISQKEIAMEMNITPPTVNYHIGILASAKMIHVVRQGRRTECFVEKT